MRAAVVWDNRFIVEGNGSKKERVTTFLNVEAKIVD